MKTRLYAVATLVLLVGLTGCAASATQLAAIGTITPAPSSGMSPSDAPKMDCVYLTGYDNVVPSMRGLIFSVKPGESIPEDLPLDVFSPVVVYGHDWQILAFGTLWHNGTISPIYVYKTPLYADETWNWVDITVAAAAYSPYASTLPLEDRPDNWIWAAAHKALECVMNGKPLEY